MQNSPARLYLEDPKPGDRFVSQEHPLDVEQIVAFARQSDPQDFHLDATLAEDFFFGGLDQEFSTVMSFNG